MSNDNYHRIRDPVHGYIHLYDDEREIVDTEVFQRLRRVNQMSMSSLVYPSATHTRFSHSLGVMHLADLFADSLGFNDRDRKTLRIAGLIHDVGHGPFSHTSDRVAHRYDYTHEQHSCDIIDDKLKSYIPEKVDVEKIKNHIKGDADINLIAGDIDADRIDYLNRDAINTGMSHGSIDYKTIVEFSEINDGKLVFDRKATYAITELLSARLYMHSAIMNHHLSRLAETMLERCIVQYVEEYSDIYEVMKFDDYIMHSELVNTDDKYINDVYSKILSRKLPKRAFTLRGNEVSDDVMYELSEINAKELETIIADKVNTDESEIIAVTPIKPKADNIEVWIKDNQKVRKLSDVSEIPDKLPAERMNQSRFHVYTSENNVEEVNECTWEVLHNKVF